MGYGAACRSIIDGYTFAFLNLFECITNVTLFGHMFDGFKILLLNYDVTISKGVVLI
jgi:hypothetical protein